MEATSAISALSVTIVLALLRPRLGVVVVGPALAAITGVILMTATGHISMTDFHEAVNVLWQPMIAIGSIMAIANVAGHLGVIRRLAKTIIRVGSGSTRKLFLLVFCLSAGTAAILNNDSAILVLTPLVIMMIRQIYPHNPRVLIPFVFAVFTAAGVAPVVTSNPINLIVSDVAGLDFNAYAVRMIPVSLVSAIATFLTLRWVFSCEIVAASQTDHERQDIVQDSTPSRWTAAQRHGLILALTILGAYPIVEYLGGSVWRVALIGAVVACALCTYHRAATTKAVILNGVAWQILIFLFGLYILALGLRNAGAVGWLIELYSPPDIATIGVVSAVGSALINNHSMALTNIVAIGALPGETHTIQFLAALIGGDLGPRLLPIGSLAGLLWYAALERSSVHVPVLQFMRVGAIVTIPSLSAGLAMLAWVA